MGDCVTFIPDDKAHSNSVENLLNEILKELNKQTHLLGAIADVDVTNDGLDEDILDGDNL